MDLNFEDVTQLYQYAQQISETKSWFSFKKTIVRLSGEFIIKCDAKLKALSDPIFAMLIKVHTSRIKSTERFRAIFSEITNKPIAVAILRKQVNTKQHVFIQHTRHDPFPERGTTYTKTIHGKQMIWRE